MIFTRDSVPLIDNEVRARREAVGLSQGELADALDSRQTINAIERDPYYPSLELAFDLADFFGCWIEALFDPSDDGE